MAAAQKGSGAAIRLRSRKRSDLVAFGGLGVTDGQVQVGK
jgi:hypothetical protein